MLPFPYIFFSLTGIRKRKQIFRKAEHSLGLGSAKRSRAGTTVNPYLIVHLSSSKEIEFFSLALAELKCNFVSSLEAFLYKFKMLRK